MEREERKDLREGFYRLVLRVYVKIVGVNIFGILIFLFILFF